MRNLLLIGTALVTLGTQPASAANFFKQPGRWFKDTGIAVNKGAIASGKGVEHLAHETGNFVEKHPVETLVGVALIAGGGYLLLSGSSLTLTANVGGVAVPVVHSGTLGVSGLIAGGSALGVAALQPSPAASRSPPTDTTPGPARVKAPRIAPASEPKLPLVDPKWREHLVEQYQNHPQGPRWENADRPMYAKPWWGDGPYPGNNMDRPSPIETHPGADAPRWEELPGNGPSAHPPEAPRILD